MFLVMVHTYPLAPEVNFLDRTKVYTSVHRSAQAASRRLATIIRGRSRLAMSVRCLIGTGNAGVYTIAECDSAGTGGMPMSLLTFRHFYMGERNGRK